VPIPECGGLGREGSGKGELWFSAAGGEGEEKGGADRFGPKNKWVKRGWEVSGRSIERGKGEKRAPRPGTPGGLFTHTNIARKKK